MNYQEYLKSDEWQSRRREVLIFWGYKCALCKSIDHVEIHHNTYDRLGKEHFTDLVPLCKNCHSMFHNRPTMTVGLEFFNWITQMKTGIDK